MNFKLNVSVLLLISSAWCMAASGQIGQFSEVEIDSEFPTLEFKNPSDSDPLRMIKFSNDLKLFSPDTLSSVFSIHDSAPENAIAVNRFGVGIGIVNADEALHVYSDASQVGYDQARVLIENNKSTTAVRTMLELVNNGGARMVFDNTNSGESWAMMTGGSDQFMISRAGTGGGEFVIRSDGSVLMGPGFVANFRLSPNGNLTILGSLNQQSDRNAKTAFERIDSQEILDKISQLPISTWQYKDDQASVRHIGPTAQDFRAAFGLGQDDQSIATVDSSGVALSAIQALNSKCERLSEMLEVKDSRIAELEGRLAAIEQMLSVQQD